MNHSASTQFFAASTLQSSFEEVAAVIIDDDANYRNAVALWQACIIMARRKAPNRTTRQNISGHAQ
jgi:hypothetical protein